MAARKKAESKPLTSDFPDRSDGGYEPSSFGKDAEALDLDGALEKIRLLTGTRSVAAEERIVQILEIAKVQCERLAEAD